MNIDYLKDLVAGYRRRGEWHKWGEAMNILRWRKDKGIPTVVYRYQISLSYDSTTKGLSELRLWVYEKRKNMYSARNLDNYISNFMWSLPRGGIHPNGLGQKLFEDIDNYEIGVKVNSESALSGHSVGTFYAYARFTRPNYKETYKRISNNGLSWRKARFSLSLPSSISKRELQRGVEKLFWKPRVFKKPKPRIKYKKTELQGKLKRARTPSQRASIRGKLTWAGKTQQEINEAMRKVREARNKR